MEDLSEKIKLPSSWTLVNPESIWRYLLVISKTGNVFNKEQLIKQGLYTDNDNNISRNLSYLKYLGIIDEERAKGKEQKFKVVDSQGIKDIIYEIKAGREEHAKANFKKHLQSHDLFTTLKSEFFKNDNDKTLNELEHFLKDGIPGKAPQYYQKGGEFLIKLLSLASLATLSGNEIKIEHIEYDKKTEDEQIEDAEIVSVNKDATQFKDAYYEEAQIVQSNTYSVKFVGPGMNTTLEILEEDDLMIVEATLNKIRKKLSNNASH